MRFLTVWNITIVASATAVLTFLCITDATVSRSSSVIAAVLFGEIWIKIGPGGNDYRMIPYRIILGADVALATDRARHPVQRPQIRTLPRRPRA